MKILLSLKEPADEIRELLEGHRVDTAEGPPPAELVSKGSYDVIFMEGGLDAIESARRADPRAEIIFFDRDAGEALEAINKGASAHFSFPVDLDRLRWVIESLQDSFALKREIAELQSQLNSKFVFEGVVGKNPQMLDIFNYLKRVAPYFKTITITGETGTGKEVIAKALHSLGPASGHPFVVCNCGGLTESLIESELFGHVRGAFTGAVSDKTGLFEAAGEGSIFLDEIGEIPLSFQPHLLRVLQDGEFRRVGSHRASKARCRVIAATNKDLALEVRKGNFREDLYYRLTPLTIKVPPLRERKDDIPLLSRHFLEKFAKRTGKAISGISRPAQTLLMSYDWPGNVRELESAIEQAAILSAEPFIGVDHLPERLQAFARKGPSPETLEEAVKTHISKVLGQCGGNRTRAAKLLGISRRALIRKIEKYSIPQ